MESKYFTPEIQDFCVGYEFEYKETQYPDKENWHKKIMPYPNNYAFMFGVEVPADYVRVPYLTQKQIEAEGWEHVGGKLQSESEQIYEKGNLEMRYTILNKIMKLQHKNYARDFSGNYDGYMIRFDGKCRCINDFRKIIKLLGI